MKGARGDAARGRTRGDDAGDTGLPRHVGPVVTVGHNAGGLIVGSPNAIIAQSVSLRRPSGGTTIQPPQGTIGDDQEASRYVAHLITRYNEFASQDWSRTTALKYGAISRNIENLFRSRWRLLPMERFEEVCRYIQGRIARTRVAKLNGSKGMRAFSTFDEYRAR